MHQHALCHHPVTIHRSALYTSLASLRTQLAQRNDVIERQSVRLGGLVGQVAALEAANARYDALLQHKDLELQQLQVGTVMHGHVHMPCVICGHTAAS